MTKTLTVNNFENYLLWFAMTKGKIQGVSLDDLDNIMAARKLFISAPFDGERAVEVDMKYMPYIRAAWSGIPVGELPRTDDLPDAVKSVAEKLKE